MARQSTFFHKCHRCIYRGQTADWEPEASPLAMIDLHAAEEPAHAEVKEVPLTRRPAAQKAAEAKPAAAKQKPKAKAKSKPKALPRPAPTPVAVSSPAG